MLNAKLKNYLHLHVLVFIAGFTAVLGELITIGSIPLVWFRMFIATILMFFFLRFKKLIKSHNFNTRKSFILRKVTEKINKIYFLHSNNSLLYYTNNQIIINHCGLNTSKKLYFKILQSASVIKKVKMIIISQLLFSIKLLFLYPTFSLKNNKIINNGVTLNNLLRDKYL